MIKIATNKKNFKFIFKKIHGKTIIIIITFAFLIKIQKKKLLFKKRNKFKPLDIIEINQRIANYCYYC